MTGKIKKVTKEEPTRCKSCNEGSAKERDECEMWNKIGWKRKVKRGEENEKEKSEMTKMKPA